MMSAVLAMLMMMPLVFGVGGYAFGEPTTMCTPRRRAAGTRMASHFETLTHLMLRRSPSARRGVISRTSQYIDGKRGEIR